MSAVHWTNAVSADFSTAADWGGGNVPGASDDAILDAAGSTAYTVTASTNYTVNSIQTASTATLAITSGTFAATAGTGTGGNAGAILVGDATVFDVGGSMNNSGLVEVNSTGSTTELFLTTSTTFSGGGHVTLSDNANNYIFGAAPATTLTNKDNTISGAGNIGNGQMTLINQKAGVINATGADALTLNTGSSTIVNAGLFEATGSGGLAFGSVTVNDSSGGLITAGSGSFVNITNADIIGGTLQSTGTGVIKLTGSATLDAATAPMTLIGAVNIADSSTLDVEGVFTNKSNISIGSTGSTTEMFLTANATLSGAGHVTMSDNANNYLFAAAATDVLVNVDNTISGAGNIGNGQMTLTNQKAGVINAVGANALVINLGGQALANAGLLEGTGAGGLTISSALVDNTTGTIQANANSGVAIVNSTVKNAGGGGITVANGAVGTLQATDVIGGALKVVGTGAFRAVGNASLLDGTKSAVTLNGPLSINDAATMGLAGSIVNSGRISLDSTGSTTILSVTANTTLSGGGQIVIGDNVNNYVFGSAATDKLVNVNNTISGAGHLGDGQMILINQAAGIINAVGGNALVVDTGSQTLVNGGLIESTGLGGLILQNATVNNAGGTLQANTGSLVTLSNTDVIGGTLLSQGTGAIQASGTDELDGRTSMVTLSGSVRVLDSGNLQLADTVVNGGMISVNSSGSTTLLTLAANTTLSGGGTVVLSDNTNNYVQGAAASDTLVNVNNTLSGAGHLGNGQLTLTNQAAGIINAVGANALVINTGAAAVNNLGLIEATGAGGLIIQNTTVNNAGATIRANNGALVTLNGADIVGGTLAVQGSGSFAASGTAELDGTTSTVNLGGPLLVQDSNTLDLAGAITNTNTITLRSSGSTTSMTVLANTTLSGGGSVVLSDNNNNYVQGAAASDILVNVNNTLSGAGHIGNGQLTLINQAAGIINAVGASALVINTGGVAATNLGLIEATGAGGLTIQTTVDNAGGVIRANTGALVSLNGADIVGGTLGVQGSGGFATVSSAELDGTTSTVSLGGPLLVQDSNTLDLAGAIANSGVITLNSTGSTTELIMAANTTLSGGGRVTLTDNSNNFIFGSSTISLSNVDNTISGAGHLGNGQLVLLNQKAGVINASGGNALIIDTGTNTITNAGLIESTGTGGLTINSPINNSGTLLAHSGVLTLVGPLTNVSGTTLTGGTYEADAGATLELPQNTGIVTDKATIILNGTGSVIEAFNTTSNMEVAIDATLTTVAAGGALEILGGRNWTSTAAFSNAGLLQLGGGTFTAPSLSNTGTTAGFGTIAAKLTNSGVVSAQAGKTLSLGILTNLSGTVLTGGTYIVGAGATLQLAKNLSIVTLNATIDLAGVGANLQSLNTGTSKQVTVDSTLATIGASGVLEVLGGRAYTSANAIANGGALQLGGGVFTSGTLTDSAAASLSGFGTLASVFSDAGKVTASGGALAFTGAGDTFAGAIGGMEVDFAGGSDALNSGTSLTAATLGLSGGAAVTLGVSFAFGGTLVDGAGTTLALGANTLTLTGAASTIAGTLSGTTGSVLVFGGGSQTLNTGASIGAQTWSLSGGDATSVATNLTYAGTFSEAATSSVAVSAADTLGFTGAVKVSGTVNGGGTLSQSGGSVAIDTGAVLGIAAWTLKTGAAATINETLIFNGMFSEDSTSSITIGAGDTLTLGGTATIAGTLGGSGALALAAGATATIGGAVSFGGAFSQGAATTSVSASDTFALTGAATFGVGAVVNGAGLLTLSNATVSGLSIGGTLTLSDLGVVDQTGSITLGDATTSAAKLTVGKSGVYKLDGDVGIARGKSASSAMTITGTLIKTAGSGVSIVAVKTTDSGLIEAASGTLEFTQALAGKGALKIDAGATLQVASTAASTLTATFNGAGATLALGKVANFAATIGGFTTGETIDLLKTTATAATLNGSDQLTIVNGSKAVATLQLSGNYAGFVFDVGSDGHGGSAITLAASPGADLPSPGAFAQAMASVGGPGAASAWREPVGPASQKGLMIALASGHHALA